MALGEGASGGMGVHAHGHVKHAKHDIHEGDHLQFLYMYINLSSMIPVGGLSLMSWGRGAVPSSDVSERWVGPQVSFDV